MNHVILMTLRIAFKALGRNKLRTALTMLGMIIGVAAVIAMVALGTGAQAHDRGTGQDGRHEPDHDLAGQHDGDGRRPHGGCGHEHAPDAGGRRSAARPAGSRSTSPKASAPASQLIYGNQNWNTSVEGTNVDLPADSVVAAEVRHVLHRRGRAARRPRSCVLGVERLGHALRRGRRSDRRADSRPQPHLPRARRDDARRARPAAA